MPKRDIEKAKVTILLDIRKLMLTDRLDGEELRKARVLLNSVIDLTLDDIGSAYIKVKSLTGKGRNKTSTNKLRGLLTDDKLQGS